jgi:hypothetical protein
MNDFEVIDRNGQRVRRTGIVQDGDRLITSMTMMDAANPALVAAAALAETVRRNKQFDARGHRPGFGTQDGNPTTMRDQYHARNRDAWRNPPVLGEIKDHKAEAPAVVPPTGTNTAEVRAAADKVIADRDQRTSEAWKAHA